ncbi:MAG: T9SS type A sorting domain-containing protein [Bacteroidetes bacterium]|nr:T9SS type A sorting domain-containing protein [Bacteroidota bacterium]
MKTSKITKSVMVLSLATLTGLTGWSQTWISPNNHQMKVKTITIIDGDTTINEQTIDQGELKDLEKDLDKLKGKNVNVMVLAAAGTDKALPNMDSLMKNIEVFTKETGDEKDQKKKVKKVIINNDVTNTSAYSYNFDTEDAEPGDIVVKEIRNESKDGKSECKKVKAVSCIKVIETQNTKNSTPTGTKNELKLETLNFYPNPSNGKFSLEFETGDKSPVAITITDVTGKQVYAETLKGEEKYKREIDLNSESKGVYVINLQQGKRSVAKKIIIE